MAKNKAKPVAKDEDDDIARRTAKRPHLTEEESKQFGLAILGEFRPDWASQWTIEKMEHECAPFKFKGPGLYIEHGSPGSGQEEFFFYTLIVPTPDPDVFLFCSYGRTNPCPTFNWIINAPVRVDDR